MTLAISNILDGIVSHAMTLGIFEQVNGHEPKSAPATKGLTAAFWADTIRPVPAASGLAATSVAIVFKGRLYTNMLAEPADMIDPNLLAAADLLLGGYSGDFDLGGTIRNVDLLGSTAGTGLSGQAGYLSQDGRLYRIFDLSIPCIVTDLWTQVA
jgi:hypothetical protein